MATAEPRKPSRAPGPPPAVPSANPGRGTALQRLKVLVVEDESIVAWALESLLEDMGHEVVETVSSGDSAVAVAAELWPDLVVMDINLGQGITGIDAAERIGSAQKTEFLFISAYGDGATRSEIERRVPGAPLLTKPIASSALERTIAALLKKGH